MKKLLMLVVGLMTTISFGQGSDAFAYSGALSTNGWLTHSGTAGQMTTLNGSLTYNGLSSNGNQTQIVAGNSEDVNLSSASPITGVAYYSTLINLPNVTGQAANSTTGNYFLMLGTLPSTGNALTIFSGRVYVRVGSVPDTFNLGILNGAGGTAAPTFSTTDYNINTTYFIVVKFDIATNTASLWINPSIGGTEGTATVTNATGTTAAPTQFERLAIRQAGTATSGTGNIQIDEVRIGTTWEYVTASVLSNNQNQISGLQVYPNPTKNILNITTDLNSTKNVEIYDMVGKKVLVENTQCQLDVSSLVTGMYIVKITEDGKTSTKRLAIN